MTAEMAGATAGSPCVSARPSASRRIQGRTATSARPKTSSTSRSPDRLRAPNARRRATPCRGVRRASLHPEELLVTWRIGVLVPLRPSATSWRRSSAAPREIWSPSHKWQAAATRRPLPGSTSRRTTADTGTTAPAWAPRVSDRSQRCDLGRRVGRDTPTTLASEGPSRSCETAAHNGAVALAAEDSRGSGEILNPTIQTATLPCSPLRLGRLVDGGVRPARLSSDATLRSWSQVVLLLVGGCPISPPNSSMCFRESGGVPLNNG
jgi:hypothetical protein